MRFLDHRFALTANGTTVRTEIVAGVTTFLTMAYIIFVQPAVLSAAGRDFGAVLAATCLATALATALMAILANYPIAVAPAMGHNFFFAYSVVVGMKVPWRVALGGVAIAGIIFVLTAGVGLRERLITAIPTSIKHAIAAGVGGLTLTAILVARRVPGAFLWGMLASTALGLPFGLTQYHGLAGRPPSLAPTFLQLDIVGAFAPGMVAVIFVFFFLALFDSVGTLVGVGEQAGLMRDGTLPHGPGEPRDRGAVSAVVVLLSAGADGRRRLHVRRRHALSGDCAAAHPRRHDDGRRLAPCGVGELIIMPLAVSIAEGVAAGLLSYALLKLASGRGRDVHPLIYVFAVLFLGRYMFLIR